MTYRNNDIYFSLEEGYSVVNGSYTIEGFAVTNGQDPDQKIYAGLTVQCGSDGKLTFEVGRKGSGSVADWFKSNIPASHNTFNENPGDLNFAFIGTLSLNIKGGSLGNRQETFIFPKVALAQGHTGFSNNWWFGGSDCSYIQDNRVICYGTNAAGATVSFVFLRGGNDVSTVSVTPKQLIDTSNWMKVINDNTLLNQMMMPGSHDAGMSELNHCAPPVGAGGMTQTQSGPIGKQLEDGSRYFDIRIDYDYNELVTYHRTGRLGCNGQSLISILDQAKDFLTAHPSEIAILKFSHIRNFNEHDPAETKERINDLLNNYSDYFYKNNSMNINLASIPIKEARGKMILVFDYTEFIDPNNGRFRYEDFNGGRQAENISVYDNYSNTSDYDEMEKDQLGKWKEYGGLGKEYLFLLSWTLTQNNPLGSSIETLAAEANGKLPDVLYDQIVRNNFGKLNIVYIDYLNANVAQSIIAYNF